MRYENTLTVPDTVEVSEIMRTLRGQWRTVIAFVVVGVLGAAAVVLFAPRKFEGQASVLARTAGVGGGSVGGRISGLGELLGGIGALGGGGSIETELQVLRSRAIAGTVVDSLQLQVRVREPEGTAPYSVFASSALPGAFKRRTYTFERTPSGSYAGNSGGGQVELTPGQPARLDVGTVTLHPGLTAPRLVIAVMDREDAITRFTGKAQITKAGGEIARVVYRGDDSLSAAAAANAIIGVYLERRRTTDRGANARRVEYVSAQLDSTAATLSRRERELRQYQEESGVLDAKVQGEIDLESAAMLRRTLTDIQVDEGAIKQLLAQADDGRITSRDLAAYPAFLRGSSVSPLVGQLSGMETQRLALLERRTERDPEVLALDAGMRAVEANIIGIARSYASAVTRQRVEMQARYDSIQQALLALPAAAERGGRLQRDVMRLSQIFTALEAQLVEARLGEIGEGGEVRPVDLATPQRDPAFPKPFLTMGIGTVGGLVAGLVAALILGWFGRWLRDPREIERVLGVTAQRVDGDAPLLMAGSPSVRTVLVVPLDSRARSSDVAQRLARTARQRALPATVLDLSGRVNGNGQHSVASDGADVGAMIERLESENGLVVVQLPGLVADATLAAMRETRPVLLVAPPGPVDRVQLSGAVETLRRLQVPCAGVVMSDGTTTAPRALT
ncbi:MAG TPA: GNVR domain-containing protein [Gemmatimonadaceae bacterium]|nr:GNVR domain-containing protein [Gemmatimonadaceae bacterium]